MTNQHRRRLGKVFSCIPLEFLHDRGTSDSFAKSLLHRLPDVTQILQKIEQGDPQAAEKLLPLVYDELRKLAAQKMRQEKPGQTLQATALVHDADLRLVDAESAAESDNLVSTSDFACCY